MSRHQQHHSGAAAHFAGAGLSFPPTLEEVQKLQDAMLQAVQGGATALKKILPADALVAILRAAEENVHQEPTLLELMLTDAETQVLVVGDTHGHFIDVAQNLFGRHGYPDKKRVFIFNGDYVDRGSWGVELLTLLTCLKLACPTSMFMLRGNHESSTCTKYYGYQAEVKAKYEKAAKDVYAASKKLFSSLPLAATVQGSTIIMHGGLFRRPPEHKRGAKRRKPSHPTRGGAAAGGLALGGLEDLRKATKGGMDPDGCGTSLLATDVLWSDPVAEPGFHENDARGVGLTFGPDITEAFLTSHGLRLIIRSHEGPDARDKRSDLPQVLQGYSVDHTTPAGQLITVFSAPDYPQFQAPTPDDEDEEEEGVGEVGAAAAAAAVPAAPAAAAGAAEQPAAATAPAQAGQQEAAGGAQEQQQQEGGAPAPVAAKSKSNGRYNNLGAVAVLRWPNYCEPEMVTFEAVTPRPKADPYYDFAVYVDSDTEPPQGSEGDGGSEMSGATTVCGGAGAASAGGAAAAHPHDAHEEVCGPAADTATAATAAAVSPAAPAGADSAGAGADASMDATPAAEVAEVVVEGAVGEGQEQQGQQQHQQVAVAVQQVNEKQSPGSGEPLQSTSSGGCAGSAAGADGGAGGGSNAAMQVDEPEPAAGQGAGAAPGACGSGAGLGPGDCLTAGGRVATAEQAGITDAAAGKECVEVLLVGQGHAGEGAAVGGCGAGAGAGDVEMADAGGSGVGAGCVEAGAHLGSGVAM